MKAIVSKHLSNLYESEVSDVEYVEIHTNSNYRILKVFFNLISGNANVSCIKTIVVDNKKQIVFPEVYEDLLCELQRNEFDRVVMGYKMTDAKTEVEMTISFDNMLPVIERKAIQDGKAYPLCGSCIIKDYNLVHIISGRVVSSGIRAVTTNIKDVYHHEIAAILENRLTSEKNMVICSIECRICEANGDVLSYKAFGLCDDNGNIIGDMLFEDVNSFVRTLSTTEKTVLEIRQELEKIVQKDLKSRNIGIVQGTELILTELN